MRNPFLPGYYHEDELREFGFASVGTDVQVARNCTVVGLERISLGDHVRIDGYSTLIAPGPGRLDLGDYIHIGGWSFLAAGEGLVMADFSGLSQGVRIYTRSDDYSGEHLTNPTVPEAFTGPQRGPVHLERHVIIGTGSVILPGVTIEEGTAVGALTLVTRSLPAWGVFGGTPARLLRPRSRRLLALEEQLRAAEAEATPEGRGPDEDLGE